MGEHTKEPWEASGHKKSPSGWPAPSRWTYVQHHFPDPPYEGELEEEWGIYPPLGESGPVALVAGEDNARRIVACVNATAAFPTESLEAGVIKELVEACEAVDDWFRRHANAGLVQSEIEFLTKVRAVLALAKVKEQE